MSTNKLTFVITARESSIRIPQKPYLKANNIYILDKILDFVEEVSNGSQIILTSESPELLKKFARDTIQCIKTENNIESGTERLSQVSTIVKSDYYLMVPCDIWFESSDIIKEFLTKCLGKNIECATLVKKITTEIQFNDISNVKVVHDKYGSSLFFARKLADNLEKYIPYIAQQMGMYFYSNKILNFFRNTEPTQYELLEKNESFRFLLNGQKMYCIETNHELHSLNTINDIEKLASLKNIVIRGK